MKLPIRNVQEEGSLMVLAIRAGIGGIMMGLANLVPGISGGTMLLAAGIYTEFIDSIAEIVTFKFRLRSILIVSSVMLASGLSILLLAGMIKDLVLDYQWIMYSIFIGLTLGGVPIVWAMIGRHTRSSWVGTIIGFAVMGTLAFFQQQQMGADSTSLSGSSMLFLAGVVGASAMILPGVSGGYLLLVLGQYVPILSAISTLKDALKIKDMAIVLGIGMHVCVPVGIGIFVGIVGVSNLLKVCLKRYKKATLGMLLGLLLGAIVGIWPFQRGVEPERGDVIKGQLVTSENIGKFSSEDFRVEFFAPSISEIAGSLGLIFFGFTVILSISRISGKK